VQGSESPEADAMQPDQIMIFGGSGSRKLAGRICEYLGVPVRAGEVLRFSEGNLFVRILENVRGRSVYLVQSTSFPANDNFMELLFWIDAFKPRRAVHAQSCRTSATPRGQKDEPRVSVRAQVCADAIGAVAPAAW
jgi:ribose-phosphate pyrophosphokinase